MVGRSAVNAISKKSQSGGGFRSEIASHAISDKKL
jgi:hypothetical protein